MKKLILILLLILAARSTFAQTDTTTTTNKFVYCEIVGFQKFLSTKVTVNIDYGQERKFFQNMRIMDEQTGKMQSFNSMVDALNYMGESGWEFVQAYTITMGQQNVYHWLLKKDLKK